MSRMSKYDYFMQIADTVRLRSPDPKTKVGAVLVDSDSRILSTGFNGPPAGFPDAELDWGNREVVYPRVVHAEMNAILYASGRYEGSVLFCTLSPCKDCIKLIAAAGIKTIFYRDRYKDIEISEKLAKEFGVFMKQHGESKDG